MRRVIICLLLLFGMSSISSSISAQEQGVFRFGFRAAYYIRANAFGTGVYGNYGITDWLSVEPGVNAILKRCSSVDVYCDFHIPLEVSTYWHVYPIVGVSVNEIGSAKDNISGWSCGLNLGLGTMYEWTGRWNLTGQVKWMGQSAIDHKSAIIVSVGIGYHF